MENNQNELLALLLGLSIEEVQNLQHLGLEELKDDKGNTVSFYLRISTGNPRHLLDKIDIDKEYIARFAPEKVLQLQKEFL